MRHHATVFSRPPLAALCHALDAGAAAFRRLWLLSLVLALCGCTDKGRNAATDTFGAMERALGPNPIPGLPSLQFYVDRTIAAPTITPGTSDVTAWQDMSG